MRQLRSLPELARPAIWEVFSREPQHWMRQYSGVANGARWGDQGFLSAHGLGQAQRWQSVVPGQLYSYKAHCRGRAVPPPDARVICFHGEPRPETPACPRHSAGLNTQARAVTVCDLPRDRAPS
jgi:hypothetical protein